MMGISKGKQKHVLSKREIKFDGYKKISKIIRHNYEQNEGSEVSCTPYSQKGSTDLPSVQMMIKHYKHLMALSYIPLVHN